MRSHLLFVPLLVSGISSAGTMDSISVRFGGGLSKPFLEQSVRSSIPGTDFSRKIPALFTTVVDLESTLRRDWWEAGLAIGIDGEVFSANRLDVTGFSVAHTSVVGGLSLLQVGAARLWVQASAGLAYPVFDHDETTGADSEMGWRKGVGIAFERGCTRVVFGGTTSDVSFLYRRNSVSSSSHWNLSQLVAKIQWGWIGPGL